MSLELLFLSVWQAANATSGRSCRVLFPDLVLFLRFIRQGSRQPPRTQIAFRNPCVNIGTNCWTTGPQHLRCRCHARCRFAAWMLIVFVFFFDFRRPCIDARTPLMSESRAPTGRYQKRNTDISSSKPNGDGSIGLVV